MNETYQQKEWKLSDVFMYALIKSLLDDSLGQPVKTNEDFREGYKKAMSDVQGGITATVKESEKSMSNNSIPASVQTYINCFRNLVGGYLEIETAQKISVAEFPTGFILSIFQNKNIHNEDIYKGVYADVNMALESIGNTLQDFLEGEKLVNFQTITSGDFSGTAMFFGDEIILIKPKSDDVWGREEAKKDILKIAAHLNDLKPRISSMEQKSSSPNPNGNG